MKEMDVGFICWCRCSIKIKYSYTYPQESHKIFSVPARETCNVSFHPRGNPATVAFIPAIPITMRVSSGTAEGFQGQRSRLQWDQLLFAGRAIHFNDVTSMLICFMKLSNHWWFQLLAEPAQTTTNPQTSGLHGDKSPTTEWRAPLKGLICRCKERVTQRKS